MSLSTAVTVTVPVLRVVPAVIVSSRFSLSVMSPATAGETGATETVTVVSALDARSSIAVTVLVPPDSPIEVSDSNSVTAGESSSLVFTAKSELPEP